jgi:hypothetical protein
MNVMILAKDMTVTCSDGRTHHGVQMNLYGSRLAFIDCNGVEIKDVTKTEKSTIIVPFPIYMQAIQHCKEKE